MRRIITIILVVTITVAFLTACGKDKKSSMSSNSNTSANNSVSSFDSVVTSSSAETSITETSVTTPPEGTTTAPKVTTKTPPQTTAPKVTTKAPQVTTQAPPVTTAAPQKQLIVPNAAQCAVIENEIMRLVNEYRASLGITPYGIEPKIIEAARIRAKECSTENNFGHTRPNGTSFSTVFTEVGYSSGGASAENLTGFSNYIIGQNYFTCTDTELKKVAQEMFDGWKASRGHNKNMINTTRTKMGVGVFTQYETNMQGEKEVAFYGIQLFTLT